MNDYSITLFLHIVGALGFFVALGLEWTSLRQLRRATTAEHLREWLRVSTPSPRLDHPLLWIASQTRVVITLGIVFLMSVKPDLIGSLLTIDVATVLGLVSALPIPGRERAQQELGM
jgi:hypothetical protein